MHQFLQDHSQETLNLVNQKLTLFQAEINKIEPTITALTSAMDEKIEILLKARARWQSDDQRRAAKLMMRINGTDADF